MPTPLGPKGPSGCKVDAASCRVSEAARCRLVARRFATHLQFFPAPPRRPAPSRPKSLLFRYLVNKVDFAPRHRGFVRGSWAACFPSECQFAPLASPVLALLLRSPRHCLRLAKPAARGPRPPWPTTAFGAVPANWLGGIPPTSGTATTLTFGATTGTTPLNQNLGSPFILNSMQIIRGTGANYTFTGNSS